MMMLVHIDYMCVSTGRSPEEEAIHWTKTGDAFVVRDEKRLSEVWLRIFFGNTKYSSVTRKLYRWQFHKISPAVYQFEKNQVTIFGNINFQRDKKYLLRQMESKTAAKQRKTLLAQQRKHNYQQFWTNVAPIVNDNRSVAAPSALINEQFQEQTLYRTNATFPVIHRPTLDVPADTLDRLQKGLCLANFLRERVIYDQMPSLQRISAQDAAQNGLDMMAPLQNWSSLAVNLLEEEAQQQAQRERTQMQALAMIIRNHFAQE